jgi:hypothetical protein
MKIINRDKLITKLNSINKNIEYGVWLDNKITQSQSLKDIYPAVNDYFSIKFSDENYEALFQIVEAGCYDCSCDNCECGDCVYCNSNCCDCLTITKIKYCG